ncbi:hypothetical protein AB4Z46_24820 [Variovorax sp. M-6]|uniref:hypothetical protein n=1 Tax=Variovorax sp. M-6 TaxID=3233041 RepID=UPI003F949933
MEPMHWEYMGALGGVIGIGWLVVVPMYRGWTPLNDKMVARVKRSIHMMAECEDRSSPTVVAKAAPSTSVRSAID